MPKSNTKPCFGALPARAIGDQRLSGLHLKLLGAIALHDRMGRNGQGCWAGNKRLAELIGCNYSRLSTALTELATWGYVEREPHPLNKRLRVLRVIYTDEDMAFVKGGDTLPTGKEFGPYAAVNSLPNGEDRGETVCLDFQEVPRFQEDTGVEYIPQKRERDKAEALEESPAEAAPVGVRHERGEGGNVRRETAAYLRKVEGVLRSIEHRRPTKGELGWLRRAMKECTQIEDTFLTFYDDPADQNLGQQAARLAAEIAQRVEAAA